jgi:uncharacterized protein (TIGR03083 family)
VSFAPTPGEIADRYADARERVIALAATLTAHQRGLPVPGTPRWTVRELLSHLVGCPISLAAGDLDGAGGEAWTQAQVEARRELSVGELIDQWRVASPRIDEAIRSGQVPAPVSFDILTHEQDLRGAIGADRVPDPLAVRFVADGFGTRATRAAAKAGLPPLSLSDPSGEWSVGTAGGVLGQAPEFEWSRALTGRRSATQVLGFDWSEDPAPYLDLLCPFGPLPGRDIVD